MKYKAEDLLKNGKIGTKDIAEITGENRNIVIITIGSILKALEISVKDVIENRISDDGLDVSDIYLDKELLECYLAMAPLIKKQRAIRAEVETKRLKDAGLI